MRKIKVIITVVVILCSASAFAQKNGFTPTKSDEGGAGERSRLKELRDQFWIWAEKTINPDKNFIHPRDIPAEKVMNQDIQEYAAPSVSPTPTVKPEPDYKPSPGERVRSRKED